MKLIDDSAMERLLNAVEALVSCDYSEPGRALTSAIISIAPLDKKDLGMDEALQEAYALYSRLLSDELKRVEARGESGRENRFGQTTKSDEEALRKAIFKLFCACYDNNWHYHASKR